MQKGKRRRKSVGRKRTATQAVPGKLVTNLQDETTNTANMEPVNIESNDELECAASLTPYVAPRDGSSSVLPYAAVPELSSLVPFPPLEVHTA
ncbi:hypothetical protein R1flu_006191 [Riccia fluitans]|uniref:Uncharacterized protein n=1 Tax=Riccia fluitans TaxID=41844 RepID=A0ABD1YVB2_9MARC